MDEKKKKYADEYGYKIFYIWENEIKSGNFSVLDKIKKLQEKEIDEKIQSN